MRRLKQPSQLLLQVSGQLLDMASALPNNLLDNFDADSQLLDSEFSTLATVCANYLILYSFTKKGTKRTPFPHV